jgi:accessory gene regulator protein AgrB
MNNLTALSLSIAALSGVATFLAVGPTAGLFLIWALTISWASYFAFGATKEALVNVIVCSIFGVAMAWIAAVLIINIPADSYFPLMASIAVSLSVLVLCLAAHFPQLATIPASVLGYSATFAYLLQTPDKLSRDGL